jgi:hypothetical protein
VNWRALDEELARWRDAGRAPEFWWRDDDASVPTPALSRLLALAHDSGVPLALAVIPLAAQPELFVNLRARVLMHGTDHRNRASAGEKKTEFAAAEPPETALQRLRRAREWLAALAGPSFVPVLVPPWNRCAVELIARLPTIALYGCSTYGARKAPLRGVTQVNTHVDIIDWHGKRGFVGDEAALGATIAHLAARRSGAADAAEPTGVLTHHAVHDADAWRFLARFFERTRRAGARWADATALFPVAS